MRYERSLTCALESGFSRRRAGVGRSFCDRLLPIDDKIRYSSLANKGIDEVHFRLHLNLNGQIRSLNVQVLLGVALLLW